MRKIAVCVVWTTLPIAMPKPPWHMPVVELHLLGVERGQFKNDVLSGRYNYAVGVEFIARKLGLVSTIGLN